ncbi:MAG: hypothetical protein O8C66_04350 [Candidatus Methanoperedens sp.]|nr:hypothetical protein [Candidatus Methanoperedens sp.]MCZ7369719.1 hypothetical protein [Candidatus Methanoperedens sp.]
MGDISNIAGFFKETIISTILFIFIFGIYNKEKNILKEKSESFKTEILDKFLINSTFELETIENKQRDRFFEKVMSYKNKTMSKELIEEITDVLEHFSNEFPDRRKFENYLTDFQNKTSNIYFVWRDLISNTFYSWISLVIFFVIFSAIFIIFRISDSLYTPLASGFFLLFLFNIFYSISFIRFHFFGDIDIFLNYKNKEETMKLLKIEFDRFVAIKRRNEKIKNFLKKPKKSINSNYHEMKHLNYYTWLTRQ